MAAPWASRSLPFSSRSALQATSCPRFQVIDSVPPDLLLLGLAGLFAANVMYRQYRRAEAAEAKVAQLETPHDPKETARDLIALHEEGEWIAHGFNLRIPYEEEELRAAMAAWEDWFDRVADLIHREMPRFSMQFRHSQRLDPYLDQKQGVDRVVSVNGVDYDISIGPEFQLRIQREQAIIQEAIDST